MPVTRNNSRFKVKSKVMNKKCRILLNLSGLYIFCIFTNDIFYLKAFHAKQVDAHITIGKV